MNPKISVFGICVETIIYLLLYNLHNCIFKCELFFEIIIVKKVVEARFDKQIAVCGKRQLMTRKRSLSLTTLNKALSLKTQREP